MTLTSHSEFLKSCYSIGNNLLVLWFCVNQQCWFEFYSKDNCFLEVQPQRPEIWKYDPLGSKNRNSSEIPAMHNLLNKYDNENSDHILSDSHFLGF